MLFPPTAISTEIAGPASQDLLIGPQHFLKQIGDRLLYISPKSLGPLVQKLLEPGSERPQTTTGPPPLYCRHTITAHLNVLSHVLAAAGAGGQEIIKGWSGKPPLLGQVRS